MSAPSLSDLAAGNVAGQLEADRALDLVLRSVAHPDTLHMSALKAWADHGEPGLAGWHRRVQKVLERS